MAPTTARPRRVACAALALVALASSCGGSREPAAEAAAPPATTAPTTTMTTTTVATTPTSPPTTPAPRPEPTTTIAITTTTTTTLPTPIPVPADIHASEPVIELGRITIPTIGVDMTMYEGIRMTTLDYGPGHWPGSAMPGQVGNVVVAGHRSSAHKVFRDIDRLAAGDEIVFHDAGGAHTYAVRHIEVVPPTALWIIDPTPTPTVTLFACHPPGSTRERIVVVADLVEG